MPARTRFKVGVAVCIFGSAVAALRAQVQNKPVFSIWATEVTDGMGGPNKCTSCPTQNVPQNQVDPGDVIRVELFVSGWDAEPEQGHCDGDPLLNQNGACGGAIGCPGMHCANNGSSCTSNQNCSGSVCVLNQCQVTPRLSAYTVTVTGDSLASGAAGVLAPYRISCDPVDCEVLSDGTCPCAHFYQQQSECSCASAFNARCDAATNLCGIGASGFIEPGRADFLFAGSSSEEAVGFAAEGSIDFTAFLFNSLFDAVVDDGTKRLLSSMLLEASGDADGVFTVSFFKNDGATFVVDAHFRLLDGFVYEDLRIDLSAVPDFDQDSVNNGADNCPNLANADQADCDGNGVGDVCDQLCAGQIAWTTFPADGAVDAREEVDAESGLPAGLGQIDVSFACFVGIAPAGDPPGPADFQVADTSGEELMVTAVTSSDDCLLAYMVMTADLLRLGEWTTISTNVEELPAGGMAPVSALLISDVGFLPGDVDGNGVSNAGDVAALRNSLSQGGAMTSTLAISADIDRSGALTTFDLIREVDLLNGANTTRAWNGETLPAKPN